MAVGACRCAGNPLRVAIACRDFAIEAGGKFGSQIRELLRHEFEEWLVKLAGFFFAEADMRWDAGCAQHGGAASVNQRVGIGHSGIYRAHASRNYCVGARRGTSVVCAWLERDIKRGALRATASGCKRQRFRMWCAGMRMPAFAHHRTRLHQHGAHHWVGAGTAAGEGRQMQCALHVPPMGCGRRFRCHRLPAVVAIAYTQCGAIRLTNILKITSFHTQQKKPR